MLLHSPGEASCRNVGPLNDSHTLQGILRVNGGGVEHHCDGVGGRSEVHVRTKKGMDDVELKPIFFNSEKTSGKPDPWTLYWDAMALTGQSSVLSTALPRNKNCLHTCWMNCLALSSN